MLRHSWSYYTWRAARRLRRAEFDEIELVHRLLRADGPGVLVDVGAHHGTSLSRFAEDGWRVFALEPDPVNRAVLTRRWGSFLNVTIDGRAVDARDGERVALYTSAVSSGISSLSPFHPSHRPTVEVETVRLETFLHDVDRVSVLKTDTEGHDLKVLETFPWHRLRPRAVVAEFEDRKTVPLGYDYHDLARFLEQRGYVVFVSEWWPVVEYGRRHRWRSLRPYPSELSDPDAWGNFIAVAAELSDRLAALTAH